MLFNFIKTAYRSIFRNQGDTFIYITGLALGLAILTACAHSPMQTREVETLLPSDSQISPWRKNGPPAIFKKERLFEHINGGAEIYFEYGFQVEMARPHLEHAAKIGLGAAGLDDIAIKEGTV